MIITRSPLRITLGGGGTDLKSYYQDHEGFLIAAAIDKYVYITLHKTFEPQLIIKYSEMEKVMRVEDVRHPIIREALKMVNIRNPELEITSLADIPAGTGLGSSGSFTTALLKALYAHERELIHPHELAERACEIEIERLQEPIGKQDQYIAAYGGITCFDYRKDGKVEARPLGISTDTLYNLEDHLLLFFTGMTRSASNILREQKDRSVQQDAAMIENLHFMKDLAFKSKVALEQGDLREFARLMNVHWQRKKERSKQMSNSRINDLYELGLREGAVGGKLIGAGGGGFLMFYAEDQIRLRKAMAGAGIKEVRFRFDFDGTRVLNQ